MTVEDLITSLSESGVVPDSIVRFDQEATPRHVRYVDLLQSQAYELLPDVVIESAGQPFAYVIRRDRLGDSHNHYTPPLARLVRILACRSDARYLCVVSVGTLEVYPIGLFKTDPVPVSPSDVQLSWKTLLSGACPLTTKKRGKDEWLESLLFSLLVDAAKGTHQSAPNLSIQQVLALVGRALFFRFLVDRGIVTLDDLDSISSNVQKLEDLFRTPKALIDTCKWLDVTFNGDLLSLEHKDYEGLLQQIGDGVETVCWHLSNIQYRSLGGQLPFDWGGIMFRHVPVDVLSQVYEDFAHEFVPDLAQTTSVHFTPRKIAEIVVDGAFSASPRPDLHNAKVLDPAAGGGVFLVLAFRRLVIEHWKAQGKRPTRKQIRNILNTQLRGFDINCDALNIAALSLYLAALEIDPSPSPLNDLKFEKLIGSVLHPVLVDHPHSLQKGCKDAELGSLSEDVLAHDAGSFDIVVANPPWTGFKGALASHLDKRLSHLLSGNGDQNEIEDVAKSRYGSPDIAFLLAATRWAKPNAALGFVIHARFLFQDATFSLRKKVFERIRVTGVMNFAALRQDKNLWPTNSAPFALLVGRNEPAQREDSFYYISPRHEPHLADMGQFRVDPSAALPVSLNSICSIHCFKSIFKGGLLGFKLIQHIEGLKAYTISEKLGDLELKLKAGYQVGEPENKTQDATYLQAFPMANVAMRFSVSPDAPNFTHEKLQWARTADIYQGPLLLFRESPKLDRELRGSLYCSVSTAFSESFSGLSFKPEHADLVDLLYVLSYSDLFLYYQLLTSSKFGVERDAALQKDMEQFPLVRLETVSGEIKQAIRGLAKRLRNKEACWEELDSAVSDLYELSSADVQLIKDTLATELPFSDIKKRASAPATQQEILAFLDVFNTLVEPFQTDDVPAKAQKIPLESVGGWIFFWIPKHSISESQPPQLTEKDILGLSAIASSYWSTQLRIYMHDGSELVGRVNQSRYWTQTQARLLALAWLQKSTEQSVQSH